MWTQVPWGEKIRKFTIKQTIKQRTVQKLRPPYPQASSRETRANKRGDSTTERRMRRRKMRKFADKQRTIKQSSK